MSRIEQLKKQNPNYTIEVIDIINSLFGKVKYTELSINLIKNERNSHKKHYEDLIFELVNEYGQDMETMKSKSYEEIRNIFRVLSEYYGHEKFHIFKKFVDYNEKNLIKENDLTKIKSFSELDLQVSLAELKMVDKDLEKQVIKLLETDEWLLVKPMSFLSSKKYGANTKWCTTQEKNPEYYLRYSRRGILIYCINKNTGDKVAAFKNLDESHEKEISFWNSTDIRIDSIESGLPYQVMNVIKNEFENNSKPNWELLSDDEKNKELMWIQKEYYEKKRYYEDEVMGEPSIMDTPMEEEIPVRQMFIPIRTDTYGGPTQAS
jgi:hypothetical protein